jgi:hypothetical protein
MDTEQIALGVAREIVRRLEAAGVELAPLTHDVQDVTILWVALDHDALNGLPQVADMVLKSAGGSIAHRILTESYTHSGELPLPDPQLILRSFRVRDNAVGLHLRVLEHAPMLIRADVLVARRKA